MIAEPAPNTITRPYRGLSVQEVDVPLTPAGIEGLLRNREIYRRTAFLVLRNGPDTALVAVRPADPGPLFSPVAELRVLSGPETTAWITDPATDVGNASSLAAVALKHQRDGVLAYVVQGKFEHVNFIWRPAPVPVRVTEVIPPHPPKLLAMAEQVVAYDEDLPPVELILDAVDVTELVAAHPAPHYLLPCRGSGVPAEQDVSFLDTHPPYHADWLLIGCERSRQFHKHFYATEPQQVDLCPAGQGRRASPGRLPDQVLPAGTRHRGGRHDGGRPLGREPGRGPCRAARAVRNPRSRRAGDQRSRRAPAIPGSRRRGTSHELARTRPTRPSSGTCGPRRRPRPCSPTRAGRRPGCRSWPPWRRRRPMSG